MIALSRSTFVSAGSLCQPLLPHRTSGGLAEQADGRDEGDNQVTRLNPCLQDIIQDFFYPQYDSLLGKFVI